jgi:hypothetical protein
MFDYQARILEIGAVAGDNCQRCTSAAAMRLWSSSWGSALSTICPFEETVIFMDVGFCLTSHEIMH